MSFWLGFEDSVFLEAVKLHSLYTNTTLEKARALIV